MHHHLTCSIRVRRAEAHSHCRHTSNENKRCGCGAVVSVTREPCSSETNYVENHTARKEKGVRFFERKDMSN